MPLLLFIVSVLYAFCRLGVFAVCNPFRWCPKSPDTDLKLEVLTPQRLFQGPYLNDVRSGWGVRCGGSPKEDVVREVA